MRHPLLHNKWAKGFKLKHWQFHKIRFSLMSFVVYRTFLRGWQRGFYLALFSENKMTRCPVIKGVHQKTKLEMIRVGFKQPQCSAWGIYCYRHWNEVDLYHDWLMILLRGRQTHEQHRLNTQTNCHWFFSKCNNKIFYLDVYLFHFSFLLLWTLNSFFLFHVCMLEWQSTFKLRWKS